MKLFSFVNSMNTLQINVSQLLKEPIGSERNYQVGGMVDIASSDDGIPVRGEVNLTRTNRSILVKSRLRLTIELTCARCLKPLGYPLTLDIEEEYFPILDTISGAPLPAPDEPSSFTIDEYQVLDLTEAARQYAVMAIPMKPLCRDDCTGLQIQP